MKNITYIVPLHVFDKTVKEYLKKAITSVANMEENEGNKLFFVGPKDIIAKAEALSKTLKLEIPVTLIENDETDFYTQVNKATLQCSTYYFSVLEYDDEYSTRWAHAGRVYSVNNNATVLIPINEFHENGQMTSFGNAIAWNPSFAGENLGVLTKDCLETFMDFNLTGALIKTEDFIACGGLKPSLKIAAWFEFMLRALQNGYSIYVVPKIGYKHVIGREGSYMVESRNNISDEEAKWLISTAKEEYFFKEDRNKVFTPAEQPLENE